MEINLEKYQNIKDMLSSPDKENKVLALSIIEEHDFKSNMCAMLLWKKHSLLKNELWKEEAPKTWQHLCELSDKNFIDIDKALTYKIILNALTKSKAPVDDIDFFMKEFGIYLTGHIKKMGYDFIKNIEMNLILEDEHTTENRQLS